MSTKVTLHVSDDELEYSHSSWDAARIALRAVNKVLKDKGIDIDFEVEEYSSAEDIPDELFEGDDAWIVVTEL